MIRMRYLQSILLAVTLVTAGSVWAGQAEKPLDNFEVIKLTKLDMGDVVIIAKIKSAASVHFSTATDDLVLLKDSGVSKAVIAAMLDRANASPASGGTAAGGGTASPAASGPSVMLVTKDGPLALKSVDGEAKTIVAPFVGMRRFINFSDVSARVRTRDQNISVTVATDRDPRKTYWMVKLDQDNDKDEQNRSIDIESPGMWGGMMTSAPDDDSMIKCDVREEKPGLWRFTPTKSLKAGEYGLYVGKGAQEATLYDFGIDR